jgi:hypothetical protein
MLIVVVCLVAACEKSPPPVTDPAKAPWLLDPKSQIELLKNDEYRIRRLAAAHLGKMGGAASEALPILEKVANDDAHPKVREEARAAADSIRSATSDSPRQ